MAWKVTEISNEELRAIPDGTADLDSPFIKPRILEMEWRIAEKQLEAANKLGAFTKQLVMATRVLWGSDRGFVFGAYRPYSGIASEKVV
jgi:hypothetical protein